MDGQKYTVEGLNTSDPKAVNAGEYANTISGTPVVKDANGNDVSSQFAVTLFRASWKSRSVPLR